MPKSDKSKTHRVKPNRVSGIEIVPDGHCVTWVEGGKKRQKVFADEARAKALAVELGERFERAKVDAPSPEGVELRRLEWQRELWEMFKKLSYEAKTFGNHEAAREARSIYKQVYASLIGDDPQTWEEVDARGQSQHGAASGKEASEMTDEELHAEARRLRLVS